MAEIKLDDLAAELFADEEEEFDTIDFDKILAPFNAEPETEIRNTEVPPWPLAERASSKESGAFGGPLLSKVSDFIQVRKFKEACLSQLQELHTITQSLTESNAQPVDLSCADVRVPPLEQMLNDWLGADLQALRASGRANSLIKRPLSSQSLLAKPAAPEVAQMPQASQGDHPKPQDSGAANMYTEPLDTDHLGPTATPVQTGLNVLEPDPVEGTRQSTHADKNREDLQDTVPRVTLKSAHLSPAVLEEKQLAESAEMLESREADTAGVRAMAVEMQSDLAAQQENQTAAEPPNTGVPERPANRVEPSQPKGILGDAARSKKREREKKEKQQQRKPLPESWSDRELTRKRLQELTEFRDWRQAMRKEAPLQCIRDCPDDQRASTPYRKMHYFTQDDEEPSCSEPLPPEVVIVARLFDPTRKSSGYQEHLILGSQRLTEFRDSIVCPVDLLVRDAGMHVPSGYFLIEDTFFDDMRAGVSAVRYSQPLVDWAASQPHIRGSQHPGAVRYQQENMEDFVFEDLNIRVGAEYLYCHQGNCEHILVFTDVRLLSRFDVLDLSAYPLLRHKTKPPPKKCHICCRRHASKMTVGDDLVVEDPCLLCEQCFDALHRTKTGELRPFDLEVYSNVL